MKYQIDQSGKIENTNKDTVLCLSNNKWDAVLIKARTKRQIQEIFRRHGQIRNYVLFTFCAGLSLLIKRNIKIKRIIIDKEYIGHEPIIEKITNEMLKDKKVPEIIFDLIGKEVMAHKRANDIASKKLKTKKTLNLEEILGQIKMTEVGKRLKDA